MSVLFSQLDRGEGKDGGDPLNPSYFGLVEKWRKIEQPLGPTTKLLRVWQAWGEDKTEVTQTSQIFTTLVEPTLLKYYSHQNLPKLRLLKAELPFLCKTTTFLQLV